MSIGYASRPCLRCRLTPGGRTCPGKPWVYGGGDLHPSFRYSCPHNRSRAVHGRSRFRFAPHGTLPYHCANEGAIRGVGTSFTPDHFRRGTARPVSCYALFKWWLPLSQHPGCLRNPTSFVTERRFRGLCRRSGLFPFWRRNLSPAAYLPGCLGGNSEFAWRRCPCGGPRPRGALPPSRAMPEANPKVISGRTSYHQA